MLLGDSVANPEKANFVSMMDATAQKKLEGNLTYS